MEIFRKSATILIIFATVLQIRELLADGNTGVIKITGGTHSSELEYNISNLCHGEVSNSVDGNVFKIAPNGNCINIYRANNCLGRFIRYIPGRLENLYSPHGHRWVEDSLVKEPLFVHSVGPCHDKCDPRNWQGVDKDGAVSVTFYDDENFIGNETVMTLNNDDCYVIPSPRRIWESLKISGDDSTACVELHSDASCGGEFTQFRPGYPHLHDLWYWGLGGENAALHASAVSRCGTFCGKVVPEIKAGNETVPGQGVVTFYDYFGYYGNAANLNLTGGCVSLQLDEYDRYLSIRTYGQCVILYGLPGCEQRQGYYTLQTGGMGKDYYVEKLLTLTIPVRPKSLRLCSPAEILDNAGIDEAITALEGGAGLQGQVVYEDVSTNSTGLSIWMLFLLPFSGILLFVSGALFGAFISKRYERINNAANCERFNVLYNMQA